MTPNLTWHIAAGLIGGAVIAQLYFGGLWWTLQQLDGEGPGARRPGAWLTVSFALRAALAMAAFTLTAQRGLAALGAALLAFWLTRLIATRRVRRALAAG